MAVLLLLIGRIERGRGNGDSRYWWLLSGVMFYASIDELFAIDERCSAPVRDALDLSGPLYFVWVIPFAFLVAVLGLVCLPFLNRLDSRARTLFVLAGLLYVGGAMGFEIIEGWLFESRGSHNLTYAATASLEETLEMAGVIVLLHALVQRLRVVSPRLTIDLPSS